MNLVDRDLVAELLASPDPDAALVLFDGVCSVVSAGPGHKGLLVAWRRDLDPEMSLDRLVHALDNVARDLGFT
jgi:hypothetical protein